MVMMASSFVVVTTTDARLDLNLYPLVSWNFYMNLLVPILHKYAPRHDDLKMFVQYSYTYPTFSFKWETRFQNFLEQLQA